MVYRSTPESMRGELPSPSFSVADYLKQRDENPDFVMVEVGHGGIPVAYQQPEAFNGQRAYIGLEAWMRGVKLNRHQMVNKKLANKAIDIDSLHNQNIFYMSYEVGGEVRREPRFDAPDDTWYVGPFETQSLLPNQAASEVYASNVFCDPHIAYHRERTQTLLGEMTRILDDNGVIVLHETITPQFVSEIDPTMLDELGLQLLALYPRVDNDPQWDQLEARYNGNAPEFRKYIDARSFYLFFGKKQDA